MHKITSKWVSKMTFDHQVGNHVVRTDTTAPLGDDLGASPKQLLLAGLAGCTGIDVASILEKMRVTYDSFEMEVEATLTEEHPKVYDHIRLVYRFSGENLDAKLDKIKKAITLSKEKYCGVSAMLEKNCPIEWELEIG